MPYLIVLIMSLIALVILFRTAKPNWKIRINVAPDADPIFKGVPNSAVSKLRSFLKKDLKINQTYTILATKEPSGRLHTRIVGTVDDGTRQRIRNFLIEVL